MWRVIVFLVVATLWAPFSHAAEPSRRLLDLMATAADLYKAGAYGEAVGVSQQALALTETEFGAAHERTGIQAYGLGLTAEAAGQLDVAERAFEKAVAIREAIYGRDSPAVALALERLAGVLVNQGRPEAAENHARRALLLRGAVIGPEHSFVAPAHELLGHISAARGDWRDALQSYRNAVRLFASDKPTQVSAKTFADNTLKDHREAFVGLARTLYQLRNSPESGGPQAAIGEGFEAAQVAWNTAAAGALARMAARLGAGDTALGRAVRGLQDKSDRIVAQNEEDMKGLATWSERQRQDKTYAALLEEFRAKSIENSRVNAPAIARQRQLVEDLQKLLARCPPGQARPGCAGSDGEREAITKELGQLSAATSGNAGAMMDLHKRMEAAEKMIAGYGEFTSHRAALRAEIDGLEREVREAHASITAAFPAYAELAEPKAMPLKDAQALLADDEAMVVILLGNDRGYVWAVDRRSANWAEIDGGARVVSHDVQVLRQALDPITADGRTQSLAEAAENFDLDRANALYRRLLGPVDNVIAGKRHLIIVPTGPLTSLPFQVLVTEPGEPGKPVQERLRDASWLIKRHALSVLPSVASLASLRKLPASGIAARPFLGIGDPKLDGPSAGDEQRGRAALPARFYRNGLADVRALRALSPLPDTAKEIETIADVLKAPREDIMLGAAATERAVKSRNLKQYRIVHFATHGLVAGDLSGLTEPALVLSPPAEPTELDDGLLTASEVAALEFDADWVVLSACNTAAGGSQGAEALSGLARAFFYAGARALLVSHWSVYSDAATNLTIETFDALARDKKLGRAEAFRRAMLKYAGAGLPPAYWAPFVVVGDGR